MNRGRHFLYFFKVSSDKDPPALFPFPHFNVRTGEIDRGEHEGMIMENPPVPHGGQGVPRHGGAEGDVPCVDCDDDDGDLNGHVHLPPTGARYDDIYPDTHPPQGTSVGVAPRQTVSHSEVHDKENDNGSGDGGDGGDERPI